MSPTATVKESAETANEAMNGSTPWRFEIVPIDSIYIDRYQRPVNEKWLKDREGQLDPAMLSAVTLSKREKSDKKAKKTYDYSAVDGQHRIELCRRNGVTEVAAVVFYDLSIETEATLFSRFQRERRSITPYQRFNADLISGDKRAKAIEKIVGDEEFTISEQEGAGSIKAVVALERIYDEDPGQLRQVLRMIRLTWNDLPYAQNERMIKGLHIFIKDTPDLDEQRFIERLQNVTPSTITGRAHNLREARGLSGAIPRFIAEAIEDAYRSRKRQTAR